MTKQATDPLGMDASRRDPGSGIPTQLLASYRLWLLAVAAGVFETALVVVDATDGEVGSAAQVAVGVAVRLLVFTAAVYLAARLRQGRNWAGSPWRCCWAGSAPCRWWSGRSPGWPRGDRWPTPWRRWSWGRCWSRPAGWGTWGR
jgi:hypothetical protein